MTMHDVTTGERRRRFKRSESFKTEARWSRAGRMRVTERDLDMLEAVARLRFLDTRQIAALFTCDCPKVPQLVRRGAAMVSMPAKQHHDGCTADGEMIVRSEKHIAARLLELYHDGYLDRPITQLQLRIKDGVIEKGSVPMVYQITREGLSVIGSARRDRLGAARMSWAAKNVETGRTFIEHTLAIADVDIAVSLAARRERTVERLSETALRGDSNKAGDVSRAFTLRPRLQRGDDLAVECDLAFGLGNPTTRKAFRYLVEVDTGSMPVRRPRRPTDRGTPAAPVDLKRTSLMRKVVGYAKAYEQELHKSVLGWQAFRVLIVTTSAARVENCRQEIAAELGSSRTRKLFLMTTLDDVRRGLHDASIFDVDGARVTLSP